MRDRARQGDLRCNLPTCRQDITLSQLEGCVKGEETDTVALRNEGKSRSPARETNLPSFLNFLVDEAEAEGATARLTIAVIASDSEEAPGIPAGKRFLAKTTLARVSFSFSTSSSH